MRKIIMGTALALSLALAGTAQAAPAVSTDFDGPTWTTGSVDDKHDWSASNPLIDQEVVDLSGGNGDRSLRISNAVTAGSFGDMPQSAPVDPAGENVDNDTLVQSFDFHSASESVQANLRMSISPSDSQGTRMNFIRLEDRFDGIRVFFNEANSTGGFAEKWIATLDRGNHEVRFVTKFIDGNNNDIAAVYIDGQIRACGTSWENYYRFTEQRNPSATDRLLWRIGSKDSPGDAIPANDGGGFYFDNVQSSSYEDSSDYTCAPNTPSGPAGPQGPKGDNGTNGVDGKNGVNGTNGANGVNGVNGANGVNGVNGKDGINSTTTLRGASIRHLRIRKISGMKFLSAKATMGGKRLSVKGRTVKVDLRGKSVGEYRVVITAKYKAGDKVSKVRSTRSLSIVRK